MKGYGRETYGDRIADVHDGLDETELDTEGAVETLAELASVGRVPELRDRLGGWRREAFTAASPRHVSVYAR